MIVEATGRRRTIGRLLELPYQASPRHDLAMFAHYRGFAADDVPPGQVRTGILEAGWSWAIPLQDRTSVGVVVDRQRAKSLGEKPHERLEAAVQRDPHLVRAAGAQRFTPVATYSNYQSIIDRGHGPNWVLLGDAFGFVDPMLSPGLFLAMHSAEWLV